jgi:hypothetical protein
MARIIEFALKRSGAAEWRLLRPPSWGLIYSALPILRAPSARLCCELKEQDMIDHSIGCLYGQSKTLRGWEVVPM